ncbi:MAG: Alg9-like mannosyltransferase family [Candidatus Paceibacter sp.]|jgi:hypothetical protein|nr:Alg9-like mannosyltransferase family [Candidatus Paceibacter sp.]
MLLFILIISLLIRLITLLAPRAIWWDGAIYVDMGKYIFSHGTIGFWEGFRPVVWPAILGSFWKLGLDSYNWGIYLQIVAGLFAVYFVYKIAEIVKSGSGPYAAVLISFSPIILAFTTVPITDIPSMAIALGAIYAFLSGAFITSGVLVACAFLFRFPQILIGLPLGIAALQYVISEKKWQPLLKLALGSFPVLIAYLLLNLKMYGNALKPIIDGSSVAAGSFGPYDHQTFFYIVAPIAENPFLILSLVFLFVFLRKPKELLANTAALLTLISGLLLCGYFSFFPHKELRYAISFLPYLAIMAGFGIYYITRRFPLRYAQPIIVGLLSVVLIVISTSLLQRSKPAPIAPQRQAFFNYFKQTPGAKILASSPQLAVDADIKLERVSGMWEDLYDHYRYSGVHFDYIAIDTCEMLCRTNNCEANKEEFFQTLGKENTQVFSNMIPDTSCRLFIYKAPTQ